SLGAPAEPSNGIVSFVTRVRTGFGTWLENFISGPYRRFLSYCLRYRYITLAASISILFVTVGIVGGGIVKFRFMPKVDGDFVTVSIKMPIGTPVEDTEKAQQYVSARITELVAELDKGLPRGEESVLRHTFSTVGSTIIQQDPGHGGGGTTSGSHRSDIIMFLTKGEERSVPAAEIAAGLRKKIRNVPGAESVTVASDLVSFGSNIDVRLAHEDFDVLTTAKDRIKMALAGYNGVSDISDNFTRGKHELKLRLKPEAKTLGITETDLGRQVRSAFYGAEALRIQRGRNEVKVMVRYPEGDRKSPADLENMRIRTRDGGEIPFSRAAYVQESQGFTAVNRTDRKRVINITASVDGKAANPEEIVSDLKNTLLTDLVNDYPGLTYDLEGEEKERKESMGSMAIGFAMALFLIYTLLAVPFKSYLQPFIIMVSIPFGIVGAILGHMIMGFDLSILSMFGIVALTGVVVNDSLLLIDFINQKKKIINDNVQAVAESAERRFRPILLTSLTTSLGLTPIILEKSMQAQFLIPMAISLGFGILFATGITLLLVPSLYLVLEDLLGLLKKSDTI
ncbi:MAG: efflux RND transporter permease subunit, partial [Nitrospirota bacterium]